jgi:predicted AlkP superfamily pyrophosphatase or phosphodiesterase
MLKWILTTVALSISNLSFSQKQPYVILISFDGFRNDYVSRYDLPNFKKFIASGAAADGLIPSFPSKTFPNHYTIVSGLYPGHHGLVDNSFYDPETRLNYGMRIREAVINPDFYGGIPLWKLCYEQGTKSASYFWVGSELKENGKHPDYYYDYDQSVPFRKRTAQVLTWLKLPEAERPHFISLYFSSPDFESHQFGPFAEQTKRSLLATDSLLGEFVKQVHDTKLPVNIVLVSDHGMSELTHEEQTYIFIDEIIDPKSNIKAVNGGTQAHIYTRDIAQRDSLFAVLSATEKNYTIMRQQDFPERWHYNNARSGDLLLLAKPGYYIASGPREKTMEQRVLGSPFGVHGYDPAKVSDMFGIFYAQGPDIKPGIRIPAFENIHIYPLIASILHLQIPKIDGRFEVLKPIRK